MPVAAADEHQDHQSASDDERKERAKTQRNPAMFSYFDAGGLIQDRNHPHACSQQYARQRNDNNDSTFAHTFHRRAFPFVNLASESSRRQLRWQISNPVAPLN
ncbi:hypothetical protein [Nitrobacter sp.]|uniref:hypothetical protein n=1 Tax=Nitrobacter sp. TaxID=29420 RepID=UPI001D690554|nr:hypothetical protein [Nitrobacter sp.]